MTEGKWSAAGSDYPPKGGFVQKLDDVVWDRGTFRDVFRGLYKQTMEDEPTKMV
jgi:hypothetical protein